MGNIPLKTLKVEIISIADKLNQKLKFQLISMEVTDWNVKQKFSIESTTTPMLLCNSQKGNIETISRQPQTISNRGNLTFSD